MWVSLLKEIQSPLIEFSDTYLQNKVNYLCTSYDLSAEYINALIELRNNVTMFEKSSRMKVIDYSNFHGVTCNKIEIESIMRNNEFPVFHFSFIYVNLGYHCLHLHSMVEPG